MALTLDPMSIFQCYQLEVISNKSNSNCSTVYGIPETHQISNGGWAAPRSIAEEISGIQTSVTKLQSCKINELHIHAAPFWTPNLSRSRPCPLCPAVILSHELFCADCRDGGYRGIVDRSGDRVVRCALRRRRPLDYSSA